MVVCCITGFGSFGDVKNNPTEALISQSLSSLHDTNSSTVTYHTSVIMVSRQHVDAWMQETFQTLVDEARVAGENLVCIHLGVSETSSEIRLERYAYNECDFRIPDVTGGQPRHVAICGSEDECGQRVETALAVMDIAQALTGGSVDCLVSEDPGRYVCNYLYYRSLMGCRENTSPEMEVKSLFVHVPNCLALDELKAHVLALIQHIVFNNSNTTTED